MGGGRWSDKDWVSYSATRGDHLKSTTVDTIYTSRSVKDVLDSGLDPKGVKMRESRDSADNPNSTAVILGLDVTGSMSNVLDVMARKGLPALVSNIYSRKPVVDPHIMCMGIGDAEAGDRAPLQITQFEATVQLISDQLTKIWLEGRGGGNRYESYLLAWYFAAMHTSIDCFEKRGKKGYIFTIGDEEPTPYLRAQDIERVLGYKPQQDKIMAEEIFTMTDRMYNVFHIIVEEGSNGMYNATHRKWHDLLGQRAIHLSDHTKLGEVIVSAIQAWEGEDVAAVAKSWDGTTSLVVEKAISGLTAGGLDNKNGVLVFK